MILTTLPRRVPALPTAMVCLAVQQALGVAGGGERPGAQVNAAVASSFEGGRNFLGSTGDGLGGWPSWPRCRVGYQGGDPASNRMRHGMALQRSFAAYRQHVGGRARPFANALLVRVCPGPVAAWRPSVPSAGQSLSLDAARPHACACPAALRCLAATGPCHWPRHLSLAPHLLRRAPGRWTAPPRLHALAGMYVFKRHVLTHLLKAHPQAHHFGADIIPKLLQGKVGGAGPAGLGCGATVLMTFDVLSSGTSLPSPRAPTLQRWRMLPQPPCSVRLRAQYCLRLHQVCVCGQAPQVRRSPHTGLTHQRSRASYQV